MNDLWNSQPLSFWVLAGVCGIGLISVGPLLWSFSKSTRNGKILAVVGTLLVAASLVVLVYPVTIDGAMCGRGAGATGWDNPPSYGGHECRDAQWRVFWAGMVLLVLGVGSSVVSLFPHFKARSCDSSLMH